MLKNRVIKVISVILVLSMIILSMTGCQKKPTTDNVILNQELDGIEYVQTQYSTIAENVKKEESVYVNLSAHGTVRTVNVTDWLHTDMPQVRIKDISNLANITNIKTLTEPIIADEFLYWDMDTTDLYYSGISSQEPPIQFTIKYFLNGEEMSAEEIAGKKGDVKIVINVENTLTKKVTVSGKNYEIACPMLMAGGMILPEENFTNISIDNGSALSDASKQIVFFAGVPGIDKSLGLSELDVALLNESMYADTYTITAYTENFEIGNMMFMVMPFSALGTVGNGDLPETVDDVKKVLTDVENLQSAMQGIDIQRVIDLLYGDTNKIEEVMNAVNDATVLYRENEKLITVLGSYMTDENMTKLNKLINDLNNTDIEALSETLNDPMLQTLLLFLPELSESLKDVSVLADDIEAAMPIFESLSKDMEDPEIKQSIENLPETLKKLNEILTVLEENQELLEVVGEMATDDNVAKIESIMATADKYSNMGTLTEDQTEALAGRVKEWIIFGEEYDIFTEKTENMSSSVVFIYKTDAISAHVVKTETEQITEENENKLVGWFKNLF